MSPRVRLAALKILTLREEFTSKELRRAVTLAEKHSMALLQGKASRSRRGASSTAKPKPAPTKSESRVVKRLRDRDPSRYAVLSQIDQALRTGVILFRQIDIQNAGYSVDKTFDGGRSKSTAIPRLMAILTTLPLERAKSLYEAWKQKAKDDRHRDTEYDDLAEFLITGKVNHIEE